MTDRAAIYLDTNVFISAFEAKDALSDSAFSLLIALKQGEFFGVTSELTLAEVFVRPLQLGDEELAKAYIEIFRDEKSIDARAIDTVVLVEAARIRAASPRIRLPDTIHVATAELTGCRAFVTNDSRLQLGPAIKHIRLGTGSVEAIHAVLA